MAESKIDITVGSVSFSGEGDPAWLAQQLDKVLKVASVIPPSTSGGATGVNPSGQATDSAGFNTTLASYIKEKHGETNQVDRFLIAADWLRRRGTALLTTASVTKALRENQQKRLGNPADCLNKNVSKGYCEKTAEGFFITPDGINKLSN
jgi:hypothetical protein